ncbi:programmed cell death protein 7 [Pristis pectinata]|uniref:programmed cell death protein 7 n=1 Tax=Pristis pectinata TaxID=685728 RepID=UPI00223E4ABE|nr:programmed cell death protein 7 [Pristis pectinata]
MEWAPPFYRGLPDRCNVPPAAAFTPQCQGRDSFYNPAGRSEEKAGAAYPLTRGQHGFPGPERNRAGGDWRPGAPSYQGGRDRGPPGGPAASLGRVERLEEQPWDQGRQEHRDQYPAQGDKPLECSPRPWGRDHPPYPHQDFPPRPQEHHQDHPPHASERPPNPWDQGHQGQLPRPQDYPPHLRAPEQKEPPSHQQTYQCRDQPCVPGAFLRQDHPAYPYQDYPQQGQSYHLPPHPYQQKHLDSQQQYPFRAHSHPEQHPPFPERIGPPPNIQNVTSQGENTSCQNQTIPQSGGLNLSTGYGPQNSQLMNQSHNNQQNFPNLSVDVPSWKNEHGIQYKSDEMAMPWPSITNFPQGLKDSSMVQQQRNESMTKFLSPELFSHDFKNSESTNEQDELWLMRFVSKCKLQASEIKKSKPVPLVSEVKESVLSACKLVAELTALCQQLRQNVENEEIWTESYLKAIEIKNVLQEKLKTLTDSEYLSSVKKKLEAIKKKRKNIQRKKQEWCLEKQEQKARMAEKEAKIDTWRMKCVREVEEKKRERELKAAADSVLSEVRKKQADAKRLVDVLRALEKLRKLRKEAAARKGVHPPPSADENFEHHIERLRKLIKKRSDLYDAEERALRVMLEGEQEEERKRENEKKLKKEREKLEKQQREVESMLFGDPELPADHPLQPFRQYYLQAEHSSHVLVQIRQEWDRYLVPGDHPDGSSIPQGWVFPCPPSSDVWGTALKQNES